MVASTPNKWVIAGTVMTGTIMAALDASIVNVALPDMSGTLGATIEEITWVVTGYMLSNVIIMPLIAWLSVRFGRKRMYAASALLFTAASMCCGLARTLPMMVLFRVLQGAGGGVLMTVSQAILREAFPLHEQGIAMGVYGMGVVLAPAFGPTLGGWLTDRYAWPWIFYVNVPIGLLNVLLVQRFIADPPYLVRERGRVDVPGIVLLALGLGALQLMLEEGQRKDWFASSFIVTLAVASGLGLALFIWRELATDRPAVDLRILKSVSFTSATALGGVLGMGLYGSLFLLPLFLQNLLGYPAETAGLALMPRSLAMAVVMPIGGLLYNRLGPRVLIATGLVVSAFSFRELSQLTTAVGFWDVFVPQVWQGVGFSLIFVALSTAALGAIEKAKMTAAAGLYNVVRQVFGSVGIAVAATTLTTGIARYHDALAEHVTMYDPVTRQWLGAVTAALRAAGSDAFTAARRALDLLNIDVTHQATVLSYNHVFALVMLLFAIALPLVLLLRATGARDDATALIGE
ncbi:MAG: MFS transporter [Gemmatimonadetes bacterium]|nr:MAG: MFS transporter [Gemmatimonadota bacterium]